MLGFLIFLATVAIVALVCYRFTHDQVAVRRFRQFTEREYYRQQNLLNRIDRLCAEYADTQSELSYIIKSEIANDYRKREIS